MQAVPVLVVLVLGYVMMTTAQYYDTDPMTDFYKRLSQLDSSYYLDEPWEDDEIELNDRNINPDIRDPEFLQHGAGNNVDGFQYISGSETRY